MPMAPHGPFAPPTLYQRDAHSIVIRRRLYHWYS
ncbi:hypothetical protein NCR_01078 [Burkholderia pseudomallei]